jgi:hypothetical protein
MLVKRDMDLHLWVVESVFLLPFAPPLVVEHGSDPVILHVLSVPIRLRNEFS